MVSLMVILFCTKCFLFVYMCLDLLNLKPINYLKIVMLTSPGFFFKEANLLMLCLVMFGDQKLSSSVRIRFNDGTHVRRFNSLKQYWFDRKKSLVYRGNFAITLVEGVTPASRLR